MLNLEPGALFCGRYEIMRALGAGGMGAVYLACDPRFRDFLVALKVLYPGVIRTREARERFRNEIVASYRVNHRNVVRAYEYFDEETFQAYAMEYVDGGDLAMLMKRSRIEWKVAVGYLEQVASGLEIVHQSGIVHRDLKPENLLMTSTGIVKISDFGVARLKGSITLTQAGAMVGTPKYVSPEYVETGECDHRGDIYAVGVIAYELLSGRSPFRADSRVSMMMERFKKDPNDLYRIVPECPPGVIEVIKKAMTVDVLSRYQTATELYEDLVLVGKGEPPRHASTKEAPPMVRSGRFSSQVEVASSSIAPKRILGDLLGRARDFKTWILAVAVLALSFALWFGPFQSKKPSLAALPGKTYTGRIVGLFGKDHEVGLLVVRSPSGPYALVGIPQCTMQPVVKDGFSCGGLSFELDTESIERGGAVGTIVERTWGVTGTWNLVEER